jgi:SlyX protein
MEPQMELQIRGLEERIAHLTRAVDDMSEIIRDQGDRLARAERAIRSLAERALDQDADASQPPANVRPPHW